ncbi:hypothetical protein Q0Z83_014920 [Actinoplanes sichuanensis]|uniref:Uncharacterized protein n=1 Tax=Actinoplanes sichuanensis TaxID=512349 RepID=A0ABW4A7M5_9ACTN|nr:hypothetical protein [Actinoplanes sichuanensis]BEL03301.1 hypothetical protein Q0Z83_014920 [Actinoplanes sichuanensis]
MRTVVFKYRETVAWGMRVALTASGSLSDRVSGLSGTVFRVDTATANVGGPALDALHSGFRMMEDAFRRRHGDRGAEIMVHSVDFVVTDFQDEAVTAAVISWVVEEFDLEPVRVAVHYSRPTGRYEFEFG